MYTISAIESYWLLNVILRNFDKSRFVTYDARMKLTYWKGF